MKKTRKKIIKKKLSRKGRARTPAYACCWGDKKDKFVGYKKLDPKSIGSSEQAKKFVQMKRKEGKKAYLVKIGSPY